MQDAMIPVRDWLYNEHKILAEATFSDLKGSKSTRQATLTLIPISWLRLHAESYLPYEKAAREAVLLKDPVIHVPYFQHVDERDVYTAYAMNRVAQLNPPVETVMRGGQLRFVYPQSPTSEQEVKGGQ